MTDVLDGEVVSEETTFTPDVPATHMLGWCQDAWDLPLTPNEEDLLHDQCPAWLAPMVLPDPGRKNGTYTLPARRCSCQCHTRPSIV